MDNDMRQIAVVGSLNMDLVAVAPRIPGVGETLTGSSYLKTPGGKGANQAFAAALLGGSVSMIGKLGSDDFGTQLRDSLTRAGCNTECVSATTTHTGVAVIIVSDAGKNCIVVVPGANGEFHVEDVAASSKKLIAADYLLLQLETPIASVVAAAAEAKSHGATVILDPAPAPRTPLPAALLANVDILTPNEVEAAQLTGRGSSPLTDAEASAAAKDLLAQGIPCVVLKLGSRGCLLATPQIETWVAAPSVAAIDSTAAGDCFNGALAVALAEGYNLVDACRFAVSAASLSVTRLGAQASIPTREQLAEFIKAQ
ncbi:ribokinase [Sphingomonas koreensis]|nr:ribokinase [Sphingomonas koreensis]